jgi:dGTP triphosphohydrolase
MFAVDHEGKFPDNLAEIYPKYISTPKTFICPSTKVSEKEVKKNFNACYDYVSGMTEKYPEDCILVYDKEENHKGEGKNVCFVSGSVKWIPREEWAKIYQQHQDSIEAYKIEEERYNEINKIIAEQNRILLEEYRRLHPNYFPSAP